MKHLFTVVLVLSLGLFALSVSSPLVFGGAADGPAVELRNGDANGDGVRELSDAIYLLQWLFGGGEEPVAIVCPAGQDDRVAELEAQLENANAVNASLQQDLDVANAALAECLVGLPQEDCDVAGDEDCNGLADCQDPACGCVEDCFSRGDEDGNGLADCLDPACDCVEDCDVRGDEDANGLADCADPACVCVEDCDVPGDEDANGLADCQDPACECPGRPDPTQLDMVNFPADSRSCENGYSPGWEPISKRTPDFDCVEISRRLMMELDFLRPGDAIAEEEIRSLNLQLLELCYPGCICDGREYRGVCYPPIFAGGGNSTRSWTCDDIACFGFFGGSSNRFTIRVTNPDVEYVNISGGGSNNIHTVIVPAGKSDIVECNLGGTNNRCVVIEE